MELTRRNLVAGSALAAGIAATATLAATSSYAEEATDAAETPSSEGQPTSADLVIVGEGMGGLATGMRALQDGVQNVVIVEVSRWPGGGSSLSNGSIHAFGMGNTEELFRTNTRSMSTSDLEVTSFLAIADFLNWVGTLGLPIEIVDPADHDDLGDRSDTDLPNGQMLAEDGSRGATAPINFFRAFENLFVETGGTVVHGTAATKIVTDDAGNITGVACSPTDGSAKFVIATTQVVLACGGWQNDDEMKSRYFGRDGWMAGNMGTPYNVASGISLAAPLDAGLAGDFGHFAGLYLPAHPARIFYNDVEMYESNDYTYDEGGKWWLWREIIDNIPQHSILVNNEGKRFCDENRYRSSADSMVASQTHATGIMICDDRAYQNWLGGVVRGMPEGEGMAEKLEFIQSDTVGGAVFEADTLEELADQMNATGVATYAVHKANLLATVEEYNAAADAGTAADLDPERVTNEARAITEAPFHAVPLRNAIFTIYGGLAIDGQARVLTRTHQPIPGLYATSPCAGGVMHEFYAGAIAHAGVTGIWAADAAAAALGVGASAAE